MTIQVDDIQVRQWLVVIDRKEDDPWDTTPNFDGLPFQVLAVTLPFLLVRRFDGCVSAIDVRKWEFRKASRAYVNGFIAECNNHPKARKRKIRTKPDKMLVDPQRCVRCGEMCVQRLVRDGVWEAFCLNCNMSKGPVPR